MFLPGDALGGEFFALRTETAAGASPASAHSPVRHAWTCGTGTTNLQEDAGRNRCLYCSLVSRSENASCSVKICLSAWLGIPACATRFPAFSR